MENNPSQEHPLLASSIRLAGVLPSSTHGHTSEIEYLRFSPDGRFLASTAEWDNKVVLIWDIAGKVLLRKLTFVTQIRDLAFSPDSTYLAIAALDTITLWEFVEEKCIRSITVSTNRLAFSPGGKEVLLVDKYGIVSFWGLAEQRMIASFPAIPGDYHCNWWASAETLPCLAATTRENQAFLWLFDSAAGEAIPLATIAADRDDGVVFSLDGELFACFATPPGQRKPHIQIFGTQEQTYKMDIVSPLPLIGTGRSQSLAISPDNAYLATANRDGTLFLWDINKQQLINTVTAHSDPDNLPYYGISALAWSPTGQYITTGGWEVHEEKAPSKGHFVIKLWEVDFSKKDEDHF
jgi:WD40 repeat protein